MGIYDRDYYRGQRTGYLDALGLSGSACKWLIGLNVLAFILEILTSRVTVPALQSSRLGVFVDLFILDTNRVLHGEVWRLLTYAFLHEPRIWQHIVFNMLFLWWFGSDVEHIYGTAEFVLFYLTSALLGGILFTAWAVAKGDVSRGIPELCLGASGAVTAVMVLCACHFPTRVIYLFFILPVPIWLFVVFQVGMDFLQFMQQAAQREEVRSNVAVVVHLAGAAFGFVYYKTQFRLTSLWPSIKAWRAERSRPRLRVVRPEGDAAEAVAVGPPAQPLDEQLEAKVDAVLEKVARSGQASLTASEREILLRASEIYKRRRT